MHRCSRVEAVCARSALRDPGCWLLLEYRDIFSLRIVLRTPLEDRHATRSWNNLGMISLTRRHVSFDMQDRLRTCGEVNFDVDTNKSAMSNSSSRGKAQTMRWKSAGL